MTELINHHVQWPIIKENDKLAVLGVLDRGVLSGPFSPEVLGLESDFAKYIGSEYCLATNSGTSALHIALAALGVGPGDEVIVPAFSFVATALAVLHQGAIPVFVDIDSENWGMNPDLVRLAITQRTKAIIPVHIHGVPCDMDPISEIRSIYNIPIVEDACQAHGAIYKGKKVGSIGDIGTFSLQSSKNLACGEGGLMITNSKILYESANCFRMFGEKVVRNESDASYLDFNRNYNSSCIGWMYRTNEMSAALARSQLKSLDYWNLKALKNANIIAAIIRDLPGISLQKVHSNTLPVFHKFRIFLDGNSLGIVTDKISLRNTMLKSLTKMGLKATLWQTQPIPAQSLFQDKNLLGLGFPWSISNPIDYSLANYPNTVNLLNSSICLFSHAYPIAAQSEELCHQYGIVFREVWLNIRKYLDT